MRARRNTGGNEPRCGGGGGLFAEDLLLCQKNEDSVCLICFCIAINGDSFYHVEFQVFPRAFDLDCVLVICILNSVGDCG